MNAPPGSTGDPGARRRADWLDGVAPAVPAELAGWLRRAGRAPARDAETLAAEAEEALARALAPGGSRREAAFHLLAADGLLTYACEEALGSDAPTAILEALARGIGRGSGIAVPDEGRSPEGGV